MNVIDLSSDNALEIANDLVGRRIAAHLGTEIEDQSFDKFSLPKYFSDGEIFLLTGVLAAKGGRSIQSIDGKATIHQT